MSERLLTLADLAATLKCSVKTARRRLADAMARDPGLHVLRAGRTILFTLDQHQRIIRALQWRSIYVKEAESTTPAAPSAPAAKPSRSRNSAQERVRELTQKLSRRQKPVGSGKPHLRALPGGRAG